MLSQPGFVTKVEVHGRPSTLEGVDPGCESLVLVFSCLSCRALILCSRCFLPSLWLLWLRFFGFVHPGCECWGRGFSCRHPAAPQHLAARSFDFPAVVSPRTGVQKQACRQQSGRCQVFARLMNRSLASAIETWKTVGAQSWRPASRCLQSHCMLSKTFDFQSVEAARRAPQMVQWNKQAAVTIRKVLQRMQNTSCSGAFDKWVQLTHERKHAVRLLAKMANIFVHRVWRTWVAFVDEAYRLAEEEEKASVLDSLRKEVELQQLATARTIMKVNPCSSR